MRRQAQHGKPIGRMEICSNRNLFYKTVVLVVIAAAVAAAATTTFLMAIFRLLPLFPSLFVLNLSSSWAGQNLSYSL